MSTRQRTRQQSDQHEQTEDSYAYETLFDLDDEITEDDIQDFLDAQAEEEELKQKKQGFWNLQTGSGLAIIAIGIIYLLQQLNFVPFFFPLQQLVALLPWLAGILIILTGFGVLSWSPSRRRKKARKRARERRMRERRARERRQQGKTMGRAKTESSAAYERARREARRAARAAERKASKAKSHASQRRQRKSRRLAKSKKDKKLAGVAAGIANFLGIEPTLVRIAFVIGAIFGSGATIPLYVILALVMPTADDEDEDKVVRILYGDDDDG